MIGWEGEGQASKEGEGNGKEMEKKTGQILGDSIYSSPVYVSIIVDKHTHQHYDETNYRNRLRRSVG